METVNHHTLSQAAEADLTTHWQLYLPVVEAVASDGSTSFDPICVVDLSSKGP